LIKEDGDWKLYRVQATMDPVNNVFVRDTVKYTGIFSAAAAFWWGSYRRPGDPCLPALNLSAGAWQSICG